MNKKCPKCQKNKPLNDFSKMAVLCRLCKKEYDKKYRKENRDKLKKVRKKYEEKHKSDFQKYQADYYQKHKREKKVSRKEYIAKNRDKINKFERDKKEKDINFKLACNLRSRLRNAVKRNQKSGSAVKDLECSIEELKQHLEKQFYLHPKTKKKMNWDNYGTFGWHIDHIIPLANFDLTNRYQFLEACCYINLQPLWAIDNLSKGAK